MFDENIYAGNYEVNLDRDKLAAGMYLLKMQMPSSVMTQSIIVQ
ncbi:MAG: hypothetical protein H0W62_04400 [Chitinophagales bacterium]|nr:hypothetical protein [Chitinophagales bacterium]